MKPTYAEIAKDPRLWDEYVDPQGFDEGGFDRRTFEEKVRLQEEIWGPEEASEEEDA